MAISFPLSVPTNIGPSNITMRAVNAIAISQSPFTFKQQIFAHTGKRWEASVSIPSIKRDLAEVWLGFLLSLEGQVGTFLMGDPNGATPQGSAATTPGTPLVNGGSQTGSTLSLDGLPASATGYLKAGDYVQLGSASTATLYKLLQDVNTNGSGEATAELWPNILSAPSDNDVVIVSSTVGRWRLSNPASSWQINEISSYGISFDAVSVVP